MSTRAEMLQVQLDGLLQQPPSGARVRRIAEIRAAIAAEAPTPEPEVEVAAVEAPEKAVHPKPKPRK